MALLVPNAAEDVMLQNILNKTAPQNLKLKLYKNNITPGESDTEATYTEANFTGYADVTLTGASWTITPGAPTLASYAQQTFTSTADQTAQSIYGVFVVQVTSGKLMWAERFANTYTIANNNDAILYTPHFTAE